MINCILLSFHDAKVRSFSDIRYIICLVSFHIRKSGKNNEEIKRIIIKTTYLWKWMWIMWRLGYDAWLVQEFIPQIFIIIIQIRWKKRREQDSPFGVLNLFILRREQDSNLRASFAGYTLSRRASSTTRAPLHCDKRLQRYK